MAERQGIWALRGLTLLALAAIGGGLWVTGGPLQGRAERRDQLRSADISALTVQADCRAAEEGAMTTDLRPTAPCPQVLRMADPVTGLPYRIEAVDARNLRLCAEFDLPLEQQARTYDWRPDRDAGGCIVHRLSILD